MNLPNKLTILRVIMIPFFVAMFYMTFIPYNYLISAIIFILACFTDFLDGYIARKYNLVTNMGKFLDPIADKVLVATALIVLLENKVAMPEVFGAIAVAIILARELIVSGFRMVAASTGMVLAADNMGKIKTICQDLACIFLLLSLSFFGLERYIYIVGLVFLVLAVIFTVWSGASYLIKNRKVITQSM